MKARTLLSPLLAIVLGALALSGLSAAFLLRQYVTRPDAVSRVSAFVTHLKSISSALEVMPPREEQQFLAQLAENHGILIFPVHDDDGMRVAGDTGSVVRLLRGAIHEAYGRDTDVYLHDGEPDQLWVRLPMHGEGDYWVGFPRRRVQQDLNTAFVVWSAVMLVLAFLAVWAIVEVIRRATHEAEHERAMFLAGISHDLRTPLGHLRLDLELAADRLEPEMQREMAADVDDIGTILEQFIDFAGTEADEPLSLVDLSELAAASAERVERAAGSVRLELKPVPRLELRPIAMQRLIVNLLNNAVRHGGGDVTLACGAHGSEVRLSVLDRGPGIAPEALKRVKEPFRRADDGRTGAAGAGLGLAIVDRIARLHGGRLELLARDGGGLEARVTLPAGQR